MIFIDMKHLKIFFALIVLIALTGCATTVTTGYVGPAVYVPAPAPVIVVPYWQPHYYYYHGPRFHYGPRYHGPPIHRR